MTPVMQVLPEELILKSGSHSAASREMCVMEAVAFVAGEKWSDQPVCACPVIGVFMRSWNDSISTDTKRTALLAPLVNRLVDSKSAADVEQRRADMAFDWLARVNAPAWLDRNPSLLSHATALRGLAPLVSVKAVKQASAALFAARDASAAASAAAWDAARAAAWDAARAAAGAAACAAACAAAWAAARAAARAAACDAASAAACAAAWDAARAAAGAAASAAAWDAASAAALDAAWDAARDAARAAARDALAPTVSALEQSALVLVDRMLAITPDTTEAEYLALCDWPALEIGK